MDVTIEDSRSVVKKGLLNVSSVRRQKHHLLNEPLIVQRLQRCVEGMRLLERISRYLYWS